MKDNLIRTAVPWLVGWLTAGLASLGITVTDDQRLALIGLIGTIAAWAYHAIAHALERRYPWASRLLGSRSQPLYVDSREVAEK